MMHFLKKRRQYEFLVLCLIWKVLLEWSYRILSASSFEIQFRLDINIIKVMLSYVIVAVVCAEICGIQRVSGFFLKMLMFFFLVPISCVYGMRNESSMFYLLTAISFWGVAVILRRYSIRLGAVMLLESKRQTEIGRKKIVAEGRATASGKICEMVSFTACVLLILWIYTMNGLPTAKAFLLTTVYEIREGFVSTTYLNYLMAVVSGIFVPFGIALGVIKGRVTETIFYTMVQLGLFLWTGNKIYLFSLLLLYFVLVIDRLDLSLDHAFLGFLFVAFIGNLSEICRNTLCSSIFSFFNRRMILDSATLKFFYYDYFLVREHEVTGLSGTLLAPFVTSQAAGDYKYAISEQYTSIASSANTGLYGGDLACIGWAAFVVVPILLLVLLIFAERSYKSFGGLFTLIFFSYIFYRLNEICIYSFFMDFSGLCLILLMVFYQKRIRHFRMIDDMPECGRNSS